MKILLSLVVSCLLLWATIQASQFRSCPPVDNDNAGICSEGCSSDSNCPGDQMCCSNGCGHVCIAPITIPYHAPPSSLCPPVDDDVAGTCDEQCSGDSDCVEGKLCCSNGCGHVCMAKVSPCSAVFQRVSNQSLIGSYLPQCKEDGSFSRTQCHGSTGFCWCVEPERGRPVSEVLRFERPQCNCTYDGVVHFVGETFSAGDGCNNCTCTLDGGVKCTEVAIPCPGQKLFYSCPSIREDTVGICVHDCSLNRDCLGSKKCCYNGCGHTCQSPVTIPYVPLNDVVLRGPTPCLSARELLQGNRSRPLLGAYTPQCNGGGRFRGIQCHEHYCWCVENGTGRPITDMVPFENVGSLKCSECVYNGRVYHHKEHFRSSDGCNECTCYGGEDIACTERACLPSDRDWFGGRDEQEGGDGVWAWWHTVLIVCISVVVFLAVVVAALVVGVFVLMKQNGQYHHQRLKEVVPEKFEVSEEDTPYERYPHTPEEVQFKTGQDSIELKVPVEDNDDHKPAHA